MRKILIMTLLLMGVSAAAQQLVDVTIYQDASLNGETMDLTRTPWDHSAVLTSSGRGSCDYVQLWEGGPKWATFNVGATITDYGELTEGADATPFNSYYDQENLAPYYNTANVGGLYPWNNPYLNGRQTTWSNSSVTSGLCDVATTLWGSNWRTPTLSELRQLVNSSNTTWTYCNGETTQYVPGCTICGYKVSGIGDYEDKSIFVPLPGFFSPQDGKICQAQHQGYYNAIDGTDGSSYHYTLTMLSGISINYLYSSREKGLSVRAVHVEDVGSKICTVTIHAEDSETYQTVVAYDGQMLSISAAPMDGCVFLRWADGSTDNPRQLTVTDDLTLTAVYYTPMCDAELRMTEVTIYQDATLNVPSVDLTRSARGCAVVSGPTGLTACEYVNIYGTRWATFNVGATITDYRCLQVEEDTLPSVDNQAEARFYNTANVGGLYLWNKPDVNRRQSTITATSGTADVATTLWGSAWVTPTWGELCALYDASNAIVATWCDGIDTQYAPGCPLKGYKVKGKGSYASDSIFLPAAGYYEKDDLSIHEIGVRGKYWDDDLDALKVGEEILNVYSEFGWHGYSVRAKRNTSTTSRLTIQSEELTTIVAAYPGEMIRLTAVPMAGYEFVGWSDGNTDNPRVYTISATETVTAMFDTATGNTVTRKDTAPATKTLRDGQLLIMRDGKTYNVLGADL